MNNMYKKIFISLALVAGLSSCDGDYTDWVQPEENTQQEAKEVAMQFTAVTDLIDLDKVEGNTVKIGDFTTANVQKITDAVYTVKAGDRSYGIPVAEDGTVAVDNLKGAVVELYGRDVEERTLEGNISAKGWTDTTDVQSQNLVVLLKTTEPVVIKVMPQPMPNYYFVTGNPNNWASSAVTPLFPTDAKHQSLTTYFWGAWDVKFWYVGDIGNWDKAYGCEVDGCNDPAGKIIGQNAQAISSPEAGFYTFSVDFSTNEYTWTMCEEQFPAEYDVIGLIGSITDWGSDIDMTQVIGKDNEKTHVWYATGVEIPENGEVKFRANHDWGANWGGQEFPYATGAKDGANIVVNPGGTYDIYFNDITKQYLFIAK